MSAADALKVAVPASIVGEVKVTTVELSNRVPKLNCNKEFVSLDTVLGANKVLHFPRLLLDDDKHRE